MAAPKSFTVHVAPLHPDRDPGGTVEFVPDAFSKTAFLLPWLSFLWHRMWIETLAYVLGLGLLVVLWRVLALPGPAVLGIALALSLLVGLEAATLRRWKLRRRGFQEAGVVVAASAAEAERRFFAEAGRAPTPVAPAPQAVAPTHPRPAGESVIGLFPEPEPGPRGYR